MSDLKFAVYKILGKNIYIDRRNGNFSDSYEELVQPPFFEVEDAPAYSNNLYKSVTFCLEISNVCNLSCSYCFNTNKTGERMRIEDAKEYLDCLFNTFNKAERYFIDVSGCGEPLMNLKFIDQVVEYAKEKSNEIDREVVVTFVTNGTLLSEEIVRFLQKRGILFGVSLDGNQFVHDANRKFVDGKGTYSTIMKNVESIEHKEFLGCAVTITKDVFPLLETLQDLSKCFSTISVKPVRSKEYGIDKDACAKWLAEYERLEQHLEERAAIGDTSLLFRLLNGDDYFGKFITRSFLGLKALSRCDGASGRIGVSIDGLFYPCIPMIGLSSKLGDVEKGFDHLPAKEFYENQIKRERCKSCDFRFSCGGECAVEKLENEGVNRFMCDFKRGLILLSMIFEEGCRSFSQDVYDRIVDFCLEKRRRTSEDPKLRNFRNSHKKLSFVEAREMFYSKKE